MKSPSSAYLLAETWAKRLGAKGSNRIQEALPALAAAAMLRADEIPQRHSLRTALAAGRTPS